MNWDRIEGNWKQLSGKVRQQWGKLTDDDLDVIDGRRDELAGRIQEVYGVTKDEADRQIERFAGSLDSGMRDTLGKDKTTGMTNSPGMERKKN
jgi:uncharacterized protein YjbJ (UPF0337 family)